MIIYFLVNNLVIEIFINKCYNQVLIYYIGYFQLDRMMIRGIIWKYGMRIIVMVL